MSSKLAQNYTIYSYLCCLTIFCNQTILNLQEKGAIKDHKVAIYSDKYIEMGKNFLPTGLYACMKI